MKKKILLFTFLICLLNFNLFGQINPIENLTWSHSHEYPTDFFELNWDEPAQPHNEIIGYNIYRNNELYRFQTETTIYNYLDPLHGMVTNCGGDLFLTVNNENEFYQNGFEIHVTAVYNPGLIESGYFQTIFTPGLALPTKGFTQSKAILFPNPTNGVLNIGNENLEKIVVFDVSGKVVSEFAPNSQINLSNLSKGLYVIKLFLSKETIVNKIIIE